MIAREENTVKLLILGWKKPAHARVPSISSSAPRSGRTRRLVRPLMVMLLLLAGQTAAAQGGHAAGPRMGGTIVYGIGQNIDSFMPVLSPTSILDDQVEVLLYRPLFYIGRNVSVDYNESIGTKVAASANNTTFTVTMRGNYKWSDGTPVTAADVAFCFDLIKQDGTKYGYYGIGGLPNLVKSFTVNSPTQFTITMTTSVNPEYFLLNGLAQLRPLPSKAWKQYSISYLSTHQTDLSVLSVVDGPFKLTKFVLNQQARFDRNPTYGGHKAYLDTFIIKYEATEQAEFADLRTGAIQVGHLGFTQYTQQSQLSNLKTFTYSIFGFGFITLNYRNPNVAFFKDMKVRQALQLAINQPEVDQSIYYGQAVNSYSPVPSVPPTYLSPTAKADAGVSHFNLAKAKALLASDGWKLDSGNILEKGGKKLAFTLTVGSESQTALRQAELIQQDMAKIGVQFTLTITPFSVILPLLGAKGTNWDAISIGWIYYPNFLPLGDGLFGTTGGANFGGFSDTGLDATITEAQTIPGYKGIHDYGDYAAKSVPALFLPQPKTIIKYAPNVHGVELNFNPVQNDAPEYLWLSK
jgi:peptide/nickel transport system substrate-binding protein